MWLNVIVYKLRRCFYNISRKCFTSYDVKKLVLTLKEDEECSKAIENPKMLN